VKLHLIEACETSGKAIVYPVLNLPVTHDAPNTRLDLFAKADRTNAVIGDEFAVEAARLAEDAIVIAVSRDRDAASSITGLPGVIPVLLRQSFTGNRLADGGVVTISARSELANLVRLGEHEAVLRVCNFRTSDVRARHTARLAELTVKISKAGGLTVYGAGNIGRQALDAAKRAGLRVDCVLDANPARTGQMLDGVPIVQPENVNKNGAVVVPALGRQIAAISARMIALGAADIMSLSELYALSRRPGEPETDYLDDMSANRLRYLTLYLMLADDRSREVLNAILLHRLTLATAPCAAVCETGHPQWFAPEFLPKRDDDVFVDGGAHDGDTVEGYVRARALGYQRIHAFEIDPDLVKAGQKRVAAYPNVTFHNVGLTDRPGELNYHRTGGTDGALASADTPGDMVKIGRIDDYVPEPATFIKLDVEGAEARVLQGAAGQIRLNKPVLGVAVYHKAHDIWDLPRRILDLNPDYRLYLRHYTDVAYETVVYAIPA